MQLHNTKTKGKLFVYDLYKRKEHNPQDTKRMIVLNREKAHSTDNG